MKTLFSIIFFLLIFTQAVLAKEFADSPINKDNYLSTLTLPMEEELNNIMKGKEKELNVVLNILKTIEFCDGVVSRTLYDKYTTTLSQLPEDVTRKIKSAERAILEKKKKNLSIVDIDSSEHYLPIKFIDNQK
ncbi:MAG: hypothetical protein OHK0040_14500 [bacterium]